MFNFFDDKRNNLSSTQALPSNNTIFTPPTAPAIIQPALNGFPNAAVQVADNNRHPFQYLQSCYDPSNPSCPFRHFFYNRLPAGVPAPSDIIKPPQVSDRLWQQVLDENPRPGLYIPVMATGFSDLHERAKWQEATIHAHSAKLDELESRIQGMLVGYEQLTSSDNGKATKLLTATQRQNKIALRIVKIMRTIEVLRRAGKRLSENEHEMLKLLQLLAKKLVVPPIDDTSIRVFAFQIKALSDESRHVQPPKPKLDDLVIEKILPILAEQQKVLQGIVEAVNGALFDYDVMVHGYHQQQG